jgi:hypothetical protein
MSDLGEFGNQLPTQFIVMFCVLALILVVATVGLFYMNTHQKKEMAARKRAIFSNSAEPDIPQSSSAFTNSTQRKYVTGDLPDLDALLDTTVLAEEPQSVPQPMPNAPPQPPALREQGAYRVKLNTGSIIEAEEVIAVLRDPRDNRLVVQIGNTAYRSLVDFPQVKQRFVEVMKELSVVVTKPDDNPPEQTRAEVVVEKPVPPQPAPEPVAPPSSVPPVTASTPPPPPPPIGPDGRMPGDLPSYKLDDQPPVKKGGLFRRTEAPPIPELDIAGAIEAYLQHKLQYSSDYAGHEIHVHTAPGGGVRIQVDDNFYEAVSDVAEQDVREFLMATIQEWQQRQIR